MFRLNKGWFEKYCWGWYIEDQNSFIITNKQAFPFYTLVILCFDNPFFNFFRINCKTNWFEKNYCQSAEGQQSWFDGSHPSIFGQSFGLVQLWEKGFEQGQAHWSPTSLIISTKRFSRGKNICSSLSRNFVLPLTNLLCTKQSKKTNQYFVKKSVEVSHEYSILQP